MIESAAEALAEETEGAIEPQGGRAWRWLSIAAVVGVGLVGTGRWLTPVAQMQLRAYKRNVAMQGLIGEASLTVRVVEPRVTGLPYGEKPRVMRGLGPEGETESQDRIGYQASKVLEVTEKDRSAESLHARGIAMLLTLKNTDSAIQELTAATKAGPNDAKVWSDLAAARYVANDPAGARDAANRALSIDPNLDDARFNRALAISRLQPAEAIKEWTEYRKHDSKSRWAIEASHNIETARDLQK